MTQKECPNCYRFFEGEGTYCSTECLNNDLPFKRKEELRQKFFNECTNKDNIVTHGIPQDMSRVNVSPHDCFEWFWDNLRK